MSNRSRHLGKVPLNPKKTVHNQNSKNPSLIASLNSNYFLIVSATFSSHPRKLGNDLQISHDKNQQEKEDRKLISFFHQGASFTTNLLLSETEL